MAETYEQYEKNKQGTVEREAFDDRLSAAMDQTVLLKAVRRRVETFVRIYEERNRELLEKARKMREEGSGIRTAAIAGGMEHDYQEVATVSGYSRAKNPEERLLLDDLKILLDQFPQEDF
jgi:hypothetical protein